MISFFRNLNQADRVALGVLIGLTLLRALPFLMYPGIHFDSDQATFGLMAIHLSKLQALPIFMYGQKYMLAVQSWLAAPLLWFFDPTIVAVKIPALIFNLAVVVFLYRFLRAKLKFSAGHAFFISLPIALPSLCMSQQWINISGGHIEPLFYTLLLFYWRERFVPFVLLSIVAVLHREYCLAAILSVWIIRFYESNERGALRRSLGVWFGCFVLGIVAIQLGARLYSSNFMGSTPPFKFNHGLENFSLSLEWIAKHIALVLGAAPILDRNLAIPFTDGSWTVLFVTLVLVAIAVFTSIRKIADDRKIFAAYLLLVSGCVCGFYLLKLQSHDEMGVRYLLLTTFIPVALFVIAFSSSIQKVRTLVVDLSLIIAFFHGYDLFRYWHQLNASPPVDVNQRIADELMRREVAHGVAPYWRAYDITFRTQERVKLASSELVRIQHYQDEFNQHKTGGVRVSTQACETGDLITVENVQICFEK